MSSSIPPPTAIVTIGPDGKNPARSFEVKISSISAIGKRKPNTDAGAILIDGQWMEITEGFQELRKCWNAFNKFHDLTRTN